MKRYVQAVIVLASAVACSNQRDANDPDRLEPASRTTTTVEAPATDIDAPPAAEQDEADRAASPSPGAGADARRDPSPNPMNATEESEDARDASEAPKAADNTDRNERDRNEGAVTPVDQGSSQSDLEITQRIRQALMRDDSLSFDAKNVKIITNDGRVTLRGAVNSAQERQTIEAAAKKVAGAGKVKNQLEVSSQ